MPSPELAQLELVADVDRVTAGLRTWCQPSSTQAATWVPLSRSQSVLERLLDRVQTLRIRLESPLVVATFGGTGSGKSTLVNAIVGEELSLVGRQRPTTRSPILFVHPDVNAAACGLPLDLIRIVTHTNPVLRDFLLLDCPDPDTCEEPTSGGNLETLRRLLPGCDVLIYVATQENYRSDRVLKELATAAVGCRFVCVQTHADRDANITSDWQRQLASTFSGGTFFFVDSLQAITERQQERRPTGEFGRLIEFLERQLAAGQRVKIRRSNLFDLLDEAITHTHERLQHDLPAVERVVEFLEQQRREMTARRIEAFEQELANLKPLWRQRVLGAILSRWGFTPFSALLRIYHSQAALLASYILVRARTPAQMALAGGMRAASWLTDRTKEQGEQASFQKLAGLNVSIGDLRAAELGVKKICQDAHIEPGGSTAFVAGTPALGEAEFLEEAATAVEQIVREAALRRSGWLTWLVYETLFGVYWLFLIVRVGKNFFYDSFWFEKPLLDTAFYIPAVGFLLVWGILLVMSFTRSLSGGLQTASRSLARNLAQHRFSEGLFPQVEEACANGKLSIEALGVVGRQVRQLREQIMSPTGFAERRPTPPN